MSALIFIAGLAIGISAFLYILSAISGGMNKVKNPGKANGKITKQNIQPEITGFKGRKTVPPGTRVCPLCWSELTKYEGLYASKVIDKSETKILIMGCRYCFKDK